MATLILPKVFIDRLDTGEYIAAYSAPQRTRSKEITGDVRQYAGGRQRSYSQIGTSGTWAVKLRDLTMSTVETLEEWMGREVQVRDHRGQLFNAVFFAVPVEEHKAAPNLYDVSLTFKFITVPEGV
jgi:hypothetical protein